jgi:6-phosphogluconolactonase (cycloisomerase 2 family)
MRPCRTTLLALLILTAPASALAQAKFVYTNDNPANRNTVSGWGVAANGSLTASVPGAPYLTGAFGSGPGLFGANRIRVRQSGDLVFVANGGASTVSVFKITPTTGALTQVPGSWSCGPASNQGINLALTPDNKYLYCANSTVSDLYFYEVSATGALVFKGSRFLPGNCRPDGMDISPNGKFLAVACFGADMVAIYDIPANGLVTPQPNSPFSAPAAGSGVSGVEFNAASTRLYAGEANSVGTYVNVFDVAANGYLTVAEGAPYFFASGKNSNVVLPSLDERFLFVTNQTSGHVTVLQMAPGGGLTLVPGSPFVSGPGIPAGMALSDDGKFLFVASLPSFISVFRIESSGALTPAPGTPFNTNRGNGLLSLVVYPPATPSTPADTTPPTTAVTGLPNVTWSNGVVTLTLTATDTGGAGVKSITYAVDGGTPTTVNGASAQVVLATDGEHVVTFFATDEASNTETPKSATVRIDRTAPQISGSPAAGWYTSDVVVSFACSDALSGVLSCSPAVTLSAEGASQSATGTATDRAGNQASKTVTVGIDKSAPTITGARSPAANAHGWNNGDVTVSFTCTDAVSGVASCSPGSVLSAEGGGQSVSGSATDKAGLTASAVVSGVNIDRTPPTIFGSRTPAPNLAGWSNTPVAVAFECADALSGVASCTGGSSVGGEGAGQSVAGSAVDKAGNEASAVVGGINVDLSPPVVAALRAPAPNAAGWNTTPVTVTFACSDALSGVVSCPEPILLASEGAGQSALGSAADLAGNVASDGIAGINVDLTPPTMTSLGDLQVEATSPAGAVATWTGGAEDAVSGLASFACSHASGSAFPLGSTLVSCAATDVAGHTASASFTVRVVDTQPPTVTPPASVTAHATSSAGAAVTFGTASAVDLLEGSLPATCSIPSGGTFAPGTTTVICSAADSSGNVGTASFTVTVVFKTVSPFFASPIKGDGDSFKQGSTIPVKFRLAGAKIRNLPARLWVAKVTGGVVGPETAAVSTSGAASENLFRSECGEQYIFNLNTKPMAAGTWQLRADLGDGVPHTVQISLR